MLLSRRFTPVNMLLLSINGMIGSAWLFAPLYAAKIAGPGAIIAWILGGAATILIALTFVEASTILPAAGGSTQIPQLSHGPFASFTMSWISWLSSVTMPPIEVMAVLQYASVYFPSLTHVVNNTPILTNSGLIWATLLLLFLSIVNVASFKGLVRFNRFLFMFKVAVMMLACIFLIKTSFHPSNFGFFSIDAITTTNWHSILSVVAIGGIAFAFTGFKHGVELAGEMTNSKRAIPLAIIGSIVICLILYLALQIAFIGALHPASLAQGWAHLSFAGDMGPFAGIAAILGLFWLMHQLHA
jgi:amino acid transporter